MYELRGTVLKSSEDNFEEMEGLAGQVSSGPLFPSFSSIFPGFSCQCLQTVTTTNFDFMMCVIRGELGVAWIGR